MAKRPPSGSSTPATESTSVVTEEAGVSEETPMVEPVAMAEPLRPDPDALAPDRPEVDVKPDPVAEQRAEQKPITEPQSSDQTPQVTPPANQSQGGSGFLGTALGGVVAAAAGYALAIFVPFPGMGTSDAPTYAESADVRAIAARVDALESAPAPDGGLSDRIAALEVMQDQAIAQPDLAPLSEQLKTLTDRIQALEQRAPTGDGAGVPADLAAEVDALRAEVARMRESGADASATIEALAAQAQERLAEAEAQAEALRTEAEDTARRARAAAALGRVQAALESGAPYASALADLESPDLPEVLLAQAETGIPSRSALQDAFPPAARLALEASLRADMGEGWSDRLSSFLQATTGARSLTPREGTDPDAVLSRAEAAVGLGEIQQAITELQGLPPEGLAEMADWLALAQQRLGAIDAVATLATAVEG